MAATLSQELESLNRVIAAHKGDLDKQIKNYKVSLPQQISQDVKAVTEEMQLLLTDLKFVDKVVRMVKQCQTNIKTEVFALKYKGKVLRKQASVDPDSSYLRVLEQQSFLKDSSPWDSKSTMLDSRDQMMISKSSRAMFVSEMSNSSSRFLPSHSKLGSSFVLGQSKSQLPRNRSYEMSTFSSKEETVASESSPLFECPRKSSKDILFAKKTDFAIMTWNDLLNSILERRSCLLQISTLASLGAYNMKDFVSDPQVL
ncbi:hypothetical protein C0J52_12598 [Blattella germanica]|nr:hypothetical protein C0J52_12598 [Blattella germanica]